MFAWPYICSRSSVSSENASAEICCAFLPAGQDHARSVKACHRVLRDLVAHELEVTGIGASVHGLPAISAGSLEPVLLVECTAQPRKQNQQFALEGPPAWPRDTRATPTLVMMLCTY